MRLAADDPLLAALVRRRLDARDARDPAPTAHGATGADRILERAERHGVAGLVAGALEPRLSTEARQTHRARAVARELDHAAHLETLRAIDRAFGDAGVRGVVLKGPLLALRTWPEPSARPTSDVDLLVGEHDLARAGAVLRALGYVQASGPAEERFRREHHHLHFAHAGAAPLELHFHAYRGFGRVLRSEPLIERSAPAPLEGLTRLGVLSPADELVYLAVHAAAHRFVRLAWLVDIVLLARGLSEATLDTARARAAATGYARALGFAAELAQAWLGLGPEVARRLGAEEGLRTRVVALARPEPPSRVLSAATRLVYTATLCDDRRAAARYAREATLRHLRGLAGGEP